MLIPTPLRASPFVVAALVSVDMLFSPGSNSPPPFPHADKLAHLLIFAGLMAAALPLGRDRGRSVAWTHRVMVTVLTVYACLSEVGQAALPINRSGDPLDTVADLVGMAGVLALVGLWRLLRRHAENRSTPDGAAPGGPDGAAPGSPDGAASGSPDGAASGDVTRDRARSAR